MRKRAKLRNYELFYFRSACACGWKLFSNGNIFFGQKDIKINLLYYENYELFLKMRALFSKQKEIGRTSTANGFWKLRNYELFLKISKITKTNNFCPHSAKLRNYELFYSGGHWYPRDQQFRLKSLCMVGAEITKN